MRGFDSSDLPREQLDAGREAEEDRLNELARTDAILMGAPGSTARTWKCSCGHVSDALGPCQSGCGRSRTVTVNGDA
jgi:hypothetical protein